MSQTNLFIGLRSFCSASSPPPSIKPSTDSADNKSEADADCEVKTFGGYTFKEEDIKGNRGGQDGLLLMAYTCGVCDTK